ncbi:MAG: hypothetical protein ICV83_15560 [Cytophagales bacterium]|nr:hypothetical protein [Cytophagales bacterium]
MKVSSNKLTAPVAPYPFAWETADFMPTPAGVVIPVPWGNGASILYEPVIRYDYRSVDGWTLLYNNFNTTSLANPSFFALYNRYRGLIRYYFWIAANNNTASTYLEEQNRAASGTGRTTSFFNFVGREIVDPAVNTGFSEQIKPYRLPSSGGWYVAQYETAYDPNLKNMTFADLALYMNLNFWNITSQTLSGPINGTSNGTLTTPSSTISNLFTSATRVAIAAVSASIFPANTMVYSSLSSIFSNGANGIVTGLANLVTGGTSSSGQQLNLSVNLNAKLDGTSTSTGAVYTNYTLGMPGLSNATSAPGYVPANNNVLGVFNLPVRPVVQVRSTLVSGPICPDVVRTSHYEYTASLNSATLAYLSSTNTASFNPDVLQIATISNIRYDILGTPTSAGVGCPGNAQETIGGVQLTNWRFGGEKGTSIIQTGATNVTLAVRVYFDVVPRNGSKTVTIVKTFRADVVRI